MLFRAENLGPLREAEVDLSKDIIVLAGPNNSGKTYLAWSVYGLHRMRPVPKVDLSGWVKQLVESPDHSIDIAEFVAAEGDKLIASMTAEYKEKLHLCFAAETSRFANTTIGVRGLPATDLFLAGGIVQESGSTLWLVLRSDGDRIQWSLHVVSDEPDPNPSTLFRRAQWGQETHQITTANMSALSLDQVHELGIDTAQALWELFRTDVFLRCTLFPAERLAVNIFAKELALERTKLVDELVDADIDGRVNAPLDLVRKKAGRYPWPIRDSLRTANDLANLARRKSRYADLADELERAVLRGSVVVADTGELRFSPNDKKDAHLEMHLAASVVKSLSSLVFYFRHLARDRDFIIIDEPELNLHPDNQRIVTRILAKAAQRGIKIMMSTHSDYILRELNHLIMLSKLSEEEATEMGYDPMWAISKDRIGVYLFDESTAKPVPIEDTGFSIKTIDDVVDKLNADEQRLYARLMG